MGTPSFSNLCSGPHSYCGLRMFMNVLSLQASAYLLWIAGRVLWRKWRKLAPLSPVAELLDRLVVLLGLLDAVYYIPCMLVLMQGVSPLLILYAPGLDHDHLKHTRAPSLNKPAGSVQPLPPPASRSGGEWTFVWPHCREIVMALNVLLHCYMAWMLRQWIVKKRTASQLLSEAPRLSTLLMAGLGVVLVFVAADNVVLHYAGMEGMAWTALAMDVLLFPACVLYLLFAYFTTARAMRGHSRATAGAGAGAEQQGQQEQGQLHMLCCSKHARMRRRLVLVGLATGAAWVLGFLADTVVWARALHGRTAPQQAYPTRLITCRLIGIVDALVLAGAMDALYAALGACLPALFCCRQRQGQRQQQQPQRRSPLSLLVGAARLGQDDCIGAVVVGTDHEMAPVKPQQLQLVPHGGGGSKLSPVSKFFGRKREGGGGSSRLPAPLPLTLVDTASLLEAGRSEGGGSNRPPLSAPSSLLRILRSRSLDALGLEPEASAGAGAGAGAAGDVHATIPPMGARGGRRWRSLAALLRPPMPRFGGRSRSLPLPLPSMCEEAEEGKQQGEGLAHVLLDLERIVREQEPQTHAQPTPASRPMALGSGLGSGSGVSSSLSNLSALTAHSASPAATAAEEAAQDDALFLATLASGLGGGGGGAEGPLRLWLGSWDLAGASLENDKAALAQLQAGAWIPASAPAAPGACAAAADGGLPDVYVLGLQRCASVGTARALRRALGQLLPQDEYALVLSVGAADPDAAGAGGSPGVHAVVVAARRALLASGAVALLSPPGNGDAMVGLRLQDASCAFVAAAVQPKPNPAGAGAGAGVWQAHHHYPWCEEGDRLLARALHKASVKPSGVGGGDRDGEAAEEARLWEVPSRYTHTVLLGSFYTRLRLSASASTSASGSEPKDYQGWAWVAHGHDTLARALGKGKGHLLPGFVEAPLRCPPSYPYPARGRAGGKEAEAGVLSALDGWMRAIATLRRNRRRSQSQRPQQQQQQQQQKAALDEAAERQLPSYPARILVHSLPAAGGNSDEEQEAGKGATGDGSSRLRLGAYSLATLVTGSPYKPVSIQATLESAAPGRLSKQLAKPKQQRQQRQRLYEYALELRGFRLEDGEEFGPLSIAGATLAYPLTHLDQGQGQGHARNASSVGQAGSASAAAAAAAADPRVDRRVHALAQSRLLWVKADSSSSSGDGDGGGRPSSPLAAAAAAHKVKLAAAGGFGDEGDGLSVFLSFSSDGSNTTDSSSSIDSSSLDGWRAALWGGEAMAHCLWRSPDYFETPHDMIIQGLGDRGRVIRGVRRPAAPVSPHGGAQRAAWGGSEAEEQQEQQDQDGACVLRNAVVVAVPEDEDEDEEEEEGGAGAGAGVTPVRLRQAALRLWALGAKEEADGAWEQPHSKGHRRASLLARHAAQRTLGQAGFLLPDLAGLAPSTPLATRVCLPLALHGRRTATLSFQLRVARRPLSDAEARCFAGLAPAPAPATAAAAAAAEIGVLGPQQ